MSKTEILGSQEVLKLKNFEELKNLKYGKKGSKKRKEFEKKALEEQKKLEKETYKEDWNPDWKGDPDHPERWKGW